VRNEQDEDREQETHAEYLEGLEEHEREQGLAELARLRAFRASICGALGVTAEWHHDDTLVSETAELRTGAIAIDTALRNDADPRLWPPGLTRAQAVARLVRIVETMREAERMQIEQEIDG